MARMLAVFLGILCLLNLGVEAIGRFNANIWWIDLRPLPAVAVIAIQIAGATSLLAMAMGYRHVVIRVVITLLLLIAIANSLTFYVLLARGSIAGWPLPFSLLVAGALGMILWSTWQPPKRFVTLSAAVTAIVYAIAFPLGQMFLFGKTDYARPADAIVVLGARAYADGRPSDALADRVRTACGPGDGQVHDTESMRDYAIAHGVPVNAITLDHDGVNTAATVRNTLPMLQEMNARRVLVVSHFYHLPRIKLSYQQAGCEVYTVPARERYTLTKMPLLVLREVAALWLYYLRGL
jgi:uncharacterized SAM-binding protein YcdF (DUF218 family)